MKLRKIDQIEYVHGASCVSLPPDELIPLSKDACALVKAEYAGAEVWGAVYQKFEDGYSIFTVGFCIPNPDRYKDKSRQGPATLDCKAHFEIAA